MRHDPRKPSLSALELAPQSYLVLLFGIFAATVGLTATTVTFAP